MTFDQQLRKTFDDLTDRLRDEIDRHVGEVSENLTASVESERAASAARAADEARRDAEQEIEEVHRELERKTDDALQEAREANRRAEEAREVSERSADSARREAERQADERLIAGVAAAELQGREQGRDEERAGGLARQERLANAVRAIDQARSLSEVLDTLVACAGREAARAGVLLVHGNELRGWRSVGFPFPPDETIRLQLSAIDASVIGEAVRRVVAQSADSAVHESMPSFAELPPGRKMLAVPLSVGGHAVAVLYADEGTREPGDVDLSPAWPVTLEVLARHAARCLETITTFRTAEVLADRRSVPSSLPGAGDHVETRSAGDGADDEKAARRYARLLISEIKLYHEADVAAGRRDRDLATRLGGEIARARVMFEQRVPAAVRHAGDYFHDELVRTLANGDPALLGNEKLEGKS